MSADEWALLSDEQREKLIEGLRGGDGLSPRSQKSREVELQAAARDQLEQCKADAVGRLDMSSEEWAVLDVEDRAQLLKELVELNSRASLLSEQSQARCAEKLKAQARAKFEALRPEALAATTTRSPAQSVSHTPVFSAQNRVSPHKPQHLDVQAMHNTDFSFSDVAQPCLHLSRPSTANSAVSRLGTRGSSRPRTAVQSPGSLTHGKRHSPRPRTAAQSLSPQSSKSHGHGKWGSPRPRIVAQSPRSLGHGNRRSQRPRTAAQSLSTQSSASPKNGKRQPGPPWTIQHSLSPSIPQRSRRPRPLAQSPDGRLNPLCHES